MRERVKNMYKMAFVNSIDPNHPVHPHSLIKIYTVILLTRAYSADLCVDSDQREQMYRLIRTYT